MEKSNSSTRHPKILVSQTELSEFSMHLIEFIELPTKLFDFLMHLIALQGCFVELFDFSIYIVELSICLSKLFQFVKHLAELSGLVELFEFFMCLVKLFSCLAYLSTLQLIMRCTTSYNYVCTQVTNIFVFIFFLSTQIFTSQNLYM